MCDEWMPTLRVPLPADAFRRLPRHPAFRYEYADGAGRLSPRPLFLHARLDLACTLARPADAPADVVLRPVWDDDWPAFAEVFAAAVAQTQPFASLTDAELDEAARTCVERTRTGSDGPLVVCASFAAAALDRPAVLGALLVTLVPGGDPADGDSYRWPTPVPAALWETCPGQPHLTWVFVEPFSRRDGIATALLRHAALALHALGHAELWSTFLVGNEQSTLWHWRNGFELVARRP